VSEEQKVPLPKHLDEITGTKAEQLSAKCRIIKDHGYDAWAKIVTDSGRGTKR
jgi:hypothetical protein